MLFYKTNQRTLSRFSLVEKREKWWCVLVGNLMEISKQTAYIIKEVNTTFIKCLPFSKNHAKHFICGIHLNIIVDLKSKILISSFYRWGKVSSGGFIAQACASKYRTNSNPTLSDFKACHGVPPPGWKRLSYVIDEAFCLMLDIELCFFSLKKKKFFFFFIVKKSYL